MSILQRIQSILVGNINELLDKVEDPETAVNQMIRDMEEAMSEMRNNTASAIATAKMTEKKLEKAGKEQRLWQQNAETALRSGDEELAKKALLRPIHSSNPKSHIADIENKIEQKANGLKIGVMGLGGADTVIGVNVMEAPTHIAGLPVAVNVACHALRSATAAI